GQLTWFDRSGQIVGAIEAPTRLHNPAFSFDLKQLLASSVGSAEQRGVWVIDLERGARTRITPDGTSPLTSPDGTRIVFTSDRLSGIADVYGRSTGRDDEHLVLQTSENKIVNDWSPDGRYIVFVST